MSSGGQGSKTKQELLEEYEKDYLARLGNEKNQPVEPSEASKIVAASSDLQDFIFELSQKNKKLEDSTYIANCVACKKPVSKDELKFAKGREFHVECFERHGNEFEPVNSDLLYNSSRLKIELIQLKNLQSRGGGSSKKSTSRGSRTKRKARRKTSKKKRISQKKKKVKRKKRAKRRTTKRRKMRKSARKKTSTRKRRSTRKAKRKATRRKPRRRTSKRKKVRKKRKARRRR